MEELDGGRESKVGREKIRRGISSVFFQPHLFICWLPNTHLFALYQTACQLQENEYTISKYSLALEIPFCWNKTSLNSLPSSGTYYSTIFGEGWKMRGVWEELEKIGVRDGNLGNSLEDVGSRSRRFSAMFSSATVAPDNVDLGPSKPYVLD